MYFKSYTVALLAIWLFSGCLAAPEPEPKAEPCGIGACANPCTVERCHTIPITSNVPIRTTHRIIPSSNCGYGLGNAGLGYSGLGYSGLGYGGLGYGGWGTGCGYGSWGLGAGLGNWGLGSGWGCSGLNGGWGLGGLNGWGCGGCWC